MFVLLIIGLIIGCLITFLCCRPAIKKQACYNQEIEKANHELQERNLELSRTKQELDFDINALNAQKLTLKNSVLDLQEQANQSANIFYQQSRSIAEEKVGQAIELLGEEYRQAKIEYEQEYENILQEMSQSAAKIVAERKAEINALKVQYDDLLAKTLAAIDANKRAEEMKTQQDFYRLNLSQTDIEEIAKLREVSQYLRNAEPLNKVIWKVYYEKPCSDLIGRVVGDGVVTGIYKITNMDNQKCYVGQAVDISSRWKQHIKRGLGAEAPTRNKLYPAMEEFGVENFSFEIIESCPREKLDEQEDFWQEYFKAKEFGYSIK